MGQGAHPNSNVICGQYVQSRRSLRPDQCGLKMMKSFMKSSLAFALLAGVFIWPSSVGFAQDAGDVTERMDRMEEQVRQLVGQVEELTFQLRETRGQLARIKSSDAGAGAPLKKKTAALAADQPVTFENDVTSEPLTKPAKKKKLEISDTAESAAATAGEEFASTVIDENGNEQPVVIKKAPKPKVMGLLPGSSDFEGQIVVAPDAADAAGGGNVETVSLGNAGDTPEAIYEHSYESLLRRQFGEAESGFRGFLARHRDHSLAGNAQYWLGETFYVQGDYKQAAQSFLTGFQDFPKSRKAADSLLKLGLSLNRLGQKEQACSAFSAVADKFPNATEAKKRAVAEQRRGNC